MNIIIQISGILGMLMIFLCFQCKKYKNVLKSKLVADIFWLVHYSLLGATSGAITNLVCCIRETVYMVDKNEKRRYAWLILFVALNWGGAFLNWSGIWNILPATVSTLGAYSFWQNNVILTKKIGIINGVLMFVYDIFAGSHIGMINESLTIISAATALICAARASRKTQTDSDNKN